MAQRGLFHRYCTRFVLVLVTAASASSADAATAYSFNAPGQYLTRAVDYQRWADLVARHLAQTPAIESCITDAASCPERLKGYREVVLRSHELSAARKLALVNRFINARHWRVETRRNDDWRTLTDFLSRGGDCEDYAIAKYFALRQVGFAADDVRVGITWDQGTHAYHAVTVVRIGDQIYFLDVDGGPRRNQTSDRFLFSINEIAVWDHVTPARNLEEDRS